MTDKSRKAPAHSAIAREIGVGIVTGHYQPGEVLPGEHDFAARYGLSRSVIREAIRILSAKGLIESRPKTGTRVRERTAWNLLDPELLAWMFEGLPPLGFVRNLFQLRMIVEPAAAELAADGRTPDQLSQMGHALETMIRAGLKSPEGQAADQRFHTLILEATGNELLMSLSSSIAAAVHWTTYFKYRSSKPPRDAIAEHRALFGAIAERDLAGAREAAMTLIRHALIDTETVIATDDVALSPVLTDK